MGVNQLKAQEEVQRPRGYHQHKGFYLSMSGGPSWGNMMDYERASTPYTINFKGSGDLFDLKIGWAVKENLILHLTGISYSMPGPTVITTVNNNSTTTKTSSSYNIGEAFDGIGMTYYLMPSNVFLSGSLGLGQFVVSGNENSLGNGKTNAGFSMQLKLGKEWWVSKNWGLGVGLAYSKTNLNSTPASGLPEELHSSRFGILFNTTFN